MKKQYCQQKIINTIEFLIFKALIDSYISHDEFVTIKNALREYNEIKSPV